MCGGDGQCDGQVQGSERHSRQGLERLLALLLPPPLQVGRASMRGSVAALNEYLEGWRAWLGSY